ncbi:MAG: hypothetical protein Q9198_000141 [Flavoplaca austrocitrina]
MPAVKKWFQGRGDRWLVVQDSADTIDDDQSRSYIDLEYFMPDAPEDRLDAETQWRSSWVAHEILADATVDDEVNTSQKLDLVSHLMANFGTFLEKSHSKGEVTRGRLAVVDRVEGFLYAIGRWSEAYEIETFHFTKTGKMLGKDHPSTLISMENLVRVLRNSVERNNTGQGASQYADEHEQSDIGVEQ